MSSRTKRIHGEVTIKNDEFRLLAPAYTVGPARAQSSLPAKLFHHWNGQNGEIWLTLFRIAKNGYLLRFEGYADFLIDFASGEVQVTPTPETNSSTVEHLYLNQVLPLMQSHQGQLVLHGSAVDIEGSAVAFLGRSGAGKSTLATSFALAGHPFLTDDGLLLARNTDGYGHHVLPSHPTVRLWEDSRLRLLGETATTVLPVQYNSKARIASSSAMPYCDQPQDLRAIYILGLERVAASADHMVGDAEEDEIYIQRLKPAEAVMALINHSFVLDIEAQDVMARHFDQFTALASSVPCFSLHYPRHYDALPGVQQALKRHSAELAKIPT